MVWNGEYMTRNNFEHNFEHVFPKQMQMFLKLNHFVEKWSDIVVEKTEPLNC